MDKKQLKKDYLWNTLAGMMDAASSVVYLAFVTQILGVYEGGIFALAYAIAQQFLTVGLYDVRTFQATDLKETYSFGVYFSTRIITCVVMIAGVAVYGCLTNGWSYSALVFFLVGIVKFFDAFEDVFQGFLQQHKRLDLAGRAKFGRILTTVVLFLVTMLISRNLVISLLVAIGCSTVVLVLLNFPPVMKRTRIEPQFKFKLIRSLLVVCFPLFVGSFLYTFLGTAPRFAIETFLSVDDQAYFAIIFMPAMVINLGSAILFRPLLTSMADFWEQKNLKSLNELLFKGIGFALALTVVVVGLAIPFGAPVLSFIYGVDVYPYLLPLVIILIGGGLNALSLIMYYMLVIVRKQKIVMLGYGSGAAVITGLAYALVPFISIMGAALSYIGGMLVLDAIFFGVVFYNIDKAKKAPVKSLQKTSAE